MAKTFYCSCEDVTAADLEEAVARGYRDVESVKRYTGFGTGWCQGKNCVALCARELAARGGSVALPITPRPPFHPLRLADLAGLADIAENDAREGREPH